MVVAKLGNTFDEKAYEARFNVQLQQQKKSMLIFCVPLLALVMLVLYARRQRYYAEHLVFSIHVYAFLLIFMGILVNAGFYILILLLRNAGLMGHRMMLMAQTETALIVVVFVGMTAYITFGLRRAYRDRLLPAIARGVAMSASIIFLIRLYRDALFYITLWTT
jgi:membrane-associated HD superfamily phosphohydrolase